MTCLNRFFVSDYLRTARYLDGNVSGVSGLNRFFVSDYLRTAPPPNH